MCGIVGVVAPGLSAGSLERVVECMNNRIVHRGPDDSGCIARESMAIGMRRLSIIDLSGGHQPISNENNDIHIVCNGEIYNFRSVRMELEKCGHVFKTKSDSEVALHAYEEYGDRFLEKLGGMFGLAILAERRNRVLLARDRVGKKPVFYASEGDQFWFGSEMKSILAANPKLAEPDYSQLGAFFQFGYILQPNTIYKRIRRLPAGHFGIYENGRFRHEPYWKLEFAPDETKSQQEWETELDSLLMDSVKARLESDVPLGVFLSGGIDSSSVVAYCHATGMRPIKTFTIGFDRPEWDESEDAAAVARHFETEHHVLKISESNLCSSLEEILNRIVFHCDEPFGDSSAIPMYHVSKLAREHVKVILSGDGGDELFAGYTSYQGALFADAYRRKVPAFLATQAIPTLALAASKWLSGGLRYKAQRIARILRNSGLPMEQGCRNRLSLFDSPSLRSLLHPDVAKEAAYLDEQFLPEPWWSKLRGPGDLVSRLSEIDIHTYMLDDILVKVDRMSMANALEVRSPILDYRMLEFAARLPSRFKVKGNIGKYLLREVLKKRVPERTSRKKKQGFSVPLREWFRGQLKPLVNDYLRSSESLPENLFNPIAVRQILDQHDRADADHSSRIWLLLVFAAWHRMYVSHSPPKFLDLPS